MQQLILYDVSSIIVNNSKYKTGLFTIFFSVFVFFNTTWVLVFQQRDGLYHNVIVAWNNPYDINFKDNSEEKFYI